MMIPLQRLADPADLRALLARVTDEFRLGQVDTYAVINVGYEDCNVLVHADRGDFVVKVFGPSRRIIALRTAGLVCAAVEAGVAHPRLCRPRDGGVVYTDVSGNAAIVMDYLEAPSFFVLGRPPTRAELAAVVDQAARLHRLGLNPPPVHDPWAITNLPVLARRLDTMIADEDRTAVHRAVEAFERVDRASLPRALIHGDLTQGNVLRTAPDGVVLIDFALVNRAPRVQELAVVAANLMHGDPLGLPARVGVLAREYEKHAPLTSVEIDALPAYTLAAAAMELLGALNARLAGADTDETTYLIELGRQELHAGIASVPGV